MRWTSLLLLLGAVIGVSLQHPECERNTVPDDKTTCEIDWKVRNDKQALAVCLEYIPSTFVKGKKVGDKIECTITPAYQCVGLQAKGVPAGDETYLMFDKCYWFPKDANGYIMNTIPAYQKGDTQDDKICKGGKLSVFYSHTHAKFVGMKAHDLGIDKLWIGIDKNGRSLEDELTIHSELWKLVKGDYWDGDKLKQIKTEVDENAASHYFMRTRSDYLHNRFQGSFEQAKGDTFKAAFACEFEAQFTSDQKWYCDKLSALGFDAVYDDDSRNNQKKTDERLPRCLYVSASSYTFNGTASDMAKGCNEAPSKLYHGSMDDGSAFPPKYAELTYKGQLRIAGFKVDKTAEDQTNSVGVKCKPGTRDYMIQVRKWRHIDNSGKEQNYLASQIEWTGIREIATEVYDADYPKNDCSDFPGDSSTIAVLNGKKIDIPPEVRAPVICSMRLFQECNNRKPCGTSLTCTNRNSYQSSDPNSNYHGFITCNCPGDNLVYSGPENAPGTTIARPYVLSSDRTTCNWNTAHNDKCAWFYFGDNPKLPPFFLTKNTDVSTDTGMQGFCFRVNFKYGGYKDNYECTPTDESNYNDLLHNIVIRDGCTASVHSGHPKNPTNFAMVDRLPNATYKDLIYEVPNWKQGTLLGSHSGAGASNADCKCTA